MPPVRSYYEILGVPETATSDEIKKSFRRLVRQFHPDVHPDKKLAQKAFVQINEAYQTLNNADKRRSYDALLASKRQRPKASSAGTHQTERPGAASSSRRQSGQSAPPEPNAASADLIRQAELAFIKGRLAQAESLAKQAYQLSPSNARACEVLGDVYAAWRMQEQALKYYSFAIQHDPRKLDVQRKVERLLSGRSYRASGVGPARSGAKPLPSPAGLVATLLGWTIFFFLFVYAPDLQPTRVLPGQERLLSGWNASVIVLIAVQGLLMGSLLRGMGFLSHCEDGLVFQTIRRGVRRSSPGLGVLVLSLAAVFYWLGLAFYLLLWVMQESSSRSLNRVFTLVTLYCLLMALIAEPFRAGMLTIGANIGFLATIAGWWLVDLTTDAIAGGGKTGY